jgi:hypothetical protein
MATDSHIASVAADGQKQDEVHRRHPEAAEFRFVNPPAVKI